MNARIMYTFSPNTLLQILLKLLNMIFYISLLYIPHYYCQHCDQYILSACKYFGFV
jgi:hypothetical protein